MKKIYSAIIAFALALTAAASFAPAASAGVGDGPALRATTIAPVCNNDTTTKVRVGVKNVGNKKRHVTVWWKTDGSFTGKMTFHNLGREILTHSVLPGQSVEFYVYPTDRPKRILLHDEVSALNCPQIIVQ